ncbi:hypothetical protein CXF29_10520, partial [Corynebacterium bovis]|uniref:AMP-binding protein n=1 Tax=Corynebacterium bovis TaxID=36808 RepID=UPI000FC1975A
AGRLRDRLADTDARATGTAGPRVVLLMDRGVDHVAAILAVTLLGGTYVPVDPTSPEDRLALIVGDCRPDAVVATADHRDLARDLLVHAGRGERPVVVPDAGDEATRADGTTSPEHAGGVVPRDLPADDPATAPRPGDVAYILYTSGSTGRPKGVAVTHGNVTALLAHARSHTATGPDDVWTVFHSFAFDFSVWELWGPLATGGHALVVGHALSRSPQDLAGALDRFGVTVLNQTPTAFAALCTAGGGPGTAGGAAGTATAPAGQPAGTSRPAPAARTASTAPALPSLRLLVFGGEALRPSALTPFRAVNPQVRVLNMYGITETTVHVTVHDLPAGHATGTSPVGRPLDGLTVHVLDDRLRPVGVGGTGVLYVAGAQVSRGYVGMPGLTAGRFVADPFLGGGRRMYCSNDVVRVLPDGTLDYIGRADRQVQLRGFRIEPGEVEAALRSVLGVTDAAVAVVDGPVGEELRAAVVTDGPGSAGSGRDLVREARRAARSAVPAYMVPQVVTVVDALPVTVNGKRDDAALQRLLLSADAGDVGAGAAGQDAGTGAAGTVAGTAAGAGSVDAGDAAADAATGTGA